MTQQEITASSARRARHERSTALAFGGILGRDQVTGGTGFVHP